jgi:hypothetical protein
MTTTGYVPPSMPTTAERASLLLILASSFSLAAGCPAGPRRADTGGPIEGRHDGGGIDTSESQEGPPRWSASFLGEWLDKQHLDLPRHEDKLLHFIYEEWFETGHIRVSVRGNDACTIEIDGIERWDQVALDKPKGPLAFQRENGNFSGKCDLPFLDYFVRTSHNPASEWRQLHSYFEYPPCSQAPPGAPTVDSLCLDYRASVTLAAESGDRRLAAFHSEWRSPYCAGFPHQLAKKSWKLVEKMTKNALATPEWHTAYPDEPDPVDRGPSRYP